MQELLKLLVTNHSIIKSKSLWILQKKIKQTEIPSSIREIIRQRLKHLNLNQVEEKAFRVLAVFYKSSLEIDFIINVTKGLLVVDWISLLNNLVKNEIIIEKNKIYYPISKIIGDIVREDISAEESFEINRFLAVRLEELYQVSEETTDKLSDDELDEITYHFVNSFHYFEKNSAKKTLLYLFASSKRCSQRFAYKKALNYYNMFLEFSNSSNLDDDKIKKMILTAVSQKGSILIALFKFKEAEQTLLDGLAKHDKSIFLKEIADIKRKLSLIYQRQSENEKALKYNLEAKIINESIRDNDGISSYYTVLGHVDTYHGNYNEALKNYQTALEYIKVNNNKVMLASCYLAIGNTFWYLRNYEKAIEFYTKQMQICEEENIRDVFGRALSNIGMVNAQLQHYQEALSFFKRAIEIGKIIGDRYQISSTYNNMSALYNSLGEYKKALICCEIVKKFKEEAKDIYGLTVLHNIIGTAYEGLNNFSKAELHFDKAIELAKSINATYYFCEFNITKALFLLDRKCYDRAYSLLKSIESLVNQLHDNSLNASFKSTQVFISFFVTEKTAKQKVMDLINETSKLILEKEDDDLDSKADIYFRTWEILSQNCDKLKNINEINQFKEKAIKIYTELASKSKYIIYSKRLNDLNDFTKLTTA